MQELQDVTPVTADGNALGEGFTAEQLATYVLDQALAFTAFPAAFISGLKGPFGENEERIIRTVVDFYEVHVEGWADFEKHRSSANYFFYELLERNLLICSEQLAPFAPAGTAVHPDALLQQVYEELELLMDGADPLGAKITGALFLTSAVGTCLLGHGVEMRKSLRLEGGSAGADLDN